MEEFGLFFSKSRPDGCVDLCQLKSSLVLLNLNACWVWQAVLSCNS